MTTMREALDEYRNGLWEDAHEYAAMGAPDEVVTQLTGIAQALDELLKLPDAPGIPWRVCSDVPATEADGDMWGQVLVRTQIGHMLMVSWRGVLMDHHGHWCRCSDIPGPGAAGLLDVGQFVTFQTP